jgi:hypothetical protein
MTTIAIELSEMSNLGGIVFVFICNDDNWNGDYPARHRNGLRCCCRKALGGIIGAMSLGNYFKDKKAI